MHACECGMFCTPEAKMGRDKDKDTLRIRHSCQVYKKEIYGFGEHICHNCHQTGTRCKTTVCAYIVCSRSKKFCEHLHAQEDATKTSATEAPAVQACVLSPGMMFFVVHTIQQRNSQSIKDIYMCICICVHIYHTHTLTCIYTYMYIYIYIYTHI